MWNTLDKHVQRWKYILFLKDSNKGLKKTKHNGTSGSFDGTLTNKWTQVWVFCS